MPQEHRIALETLILAFDQVADRLEKAEQIAFLRAQAHEQLLPLQAKLVCEQSFKPRAAKLEAAKFRTVEHIEGSFDMVLLLPERQRDQTLADIARAFGLLKEGGTLMICLHNDWGAKRYEKHVAEAAGGLTNLSKHHCRVFWTTKSAELDQAMLTEWRCHRGLRRVLDGKYWSQPGFFSWDEVDGGSAMLAEHLPTDLKGHGADLGAGWGYLSSQVLTRCHDVTSMDLLEADREALEAARRNVGQLQSPCRIQCLWADVPNEVPAGRYDFVVMNPPFHDGREPDHLLGAKFIAAAARALKTDGSLWMVANRHLAYEHLLSEAFTEKTLVFQDGSFKVLHASGPKESMTLPRSRERKGKWDSKKRK